MLFGGGKKRKKKERKKVEMLHWLQLKTQSEQATGQLREANKMLTDANDWDTTLGCTSADRW
jgi:hypothetical protein